VTVFLLILVVAVITYGFCKCCEELDYLRHHGMFPDEARRRERRRR
jgi:hypothetical protein